MTLPPGTNLIPNSQSIDDFALSYIARSRVGLRSLFDNDNPTIAPQRRGVLLLCAMTTSTTSKSRNGVGQTTIDLLSAALQVDAAALHAVWSVESARASFQADGRPTILFERHIFWRRLVAYGIDPQIHAAREPGLVSRAPGEYGSAASQHARLARAENIHRAAARESASWGAFQIMGFHWRALGYDSIDTFVDAMYRDEAAHFDALARFLRLDPRLLPALRAQNWSTFAFAYNGPAYRKNRYDEKLAHAYQQFKATTESLSSGGAPQQGFKIV